jgi:type I restriction enzyme R subunit
VPHYNRRADLVCFVNGLPLLFMELKNIHRDLLVCVAYSAELEEITSNWEDSRHYAPFLS